MRYLWSQISNFFSLKKSNVLCFAFIFSVCLLSCSHSNTKTNSSVKKQNKIAYKSYIKGVTLFKKENLSSARTHFESINKGNKYFVPALLEIQKMNYIEGNWNSFFGIANYYRTVLLSSKSLIRKHFQQELLALEVLALIRHCRFNLAYQIVEYGVYAGRSANKETLKIRQAGYFFKLKELVVDKKLKKQKADIIRRMHFWPLKEDQLKWVDNPKNIKVKVQSKC